MVDYFIDVRVLIDTAKVIKNTDIYNILNTLQNICGVTAQIQNNWVGAGAT